MGCGGSRADAIEPRYYESWTRETESTWLTSTDTELPQAGLGQQCKEDHSAGETGVRDKRGPSHPGIIEDGKSTQTCVTVSCSGKEGLKKTNSGTQCGKPTVYSTGSKGQKQKSVCRSSEPKRESKRMSKKEVTINVSKSIKPMDSDGRITENCVN
ncbi:brain and acute leukemia cytoplasmic protein [Spea bombifrons]|uniref:brain and acute leukemia cytoplasmic protein n=1 Tax=Spea bombifrons TaxID=233779 RepID=UPI00234A202F|nr:brain and acute leukemia cytoplasmic protein [Spea bombifrons]